MRGAITGIEFGTPNVVPLRDDNILGSVCAADLDGRQVPSREWLVEGAIPHHNVTLLSGDGGLGKTILGLMLGTALATRTQWLGPSTLQGPFLYVGAEDDQDELHRRLDQIRQDQPWGELSDFHIKSFAGEDALLGTFDRTAQAIRATALLEKIEDRLRDLGGIACVIDTSADVFGGEEINRTQVRQFIGLLRGICIRNRLAIVLLSHPSLSGMATGSGTSGSTAWNNSVQSRLYLEADGDDSDARIFKFMKSNYGPKGQPMRLRWQDGMFIPDDGKADASALINAEIRFVQTLDKYSEQKRNVSASTGTSYAPAMFARDPLCKAFSKKVLQDAMNSLFAKDEIAVEMFGPPSKQRSRIVRK